MRFEGVGCGLAYAIAGQAQSPAPQSVWFGPQDPALRTWSGISGSVDYMNLFSPTAPWSGAAAHVQVFKVYPSVFVDGFLSNSLSDDDIRRMLADISRRHMALAIEWGPLVPQDGCGAGAEGFTGDVALTLASLIVSSAITPLTASLFTHIFLGEAPISPFALGLRQIGRAHV